MHSLQRKRECYICLYLWKILDGLPPNYGTEVAYIRTGRYCKIPKVTPSTPYRLQTIRFWNMGVQGLRFFNCLPLNLWSISGCSDGSRNKSRINSEINLEFNLEINPEFNQEINPNLIQYLNLETNPEFNLKINPEINL